MPQPTIKNTHVDSALTTLSVAYIQNTDEFVATKVFPTVPSEMASDLYYKYSAADFMSDDMKPRAAGTESAGGGYDLDTDTYSCKVYAYHIDVPDQVRHNSDPALDPDRDATNFVTQKALIQRERLFATNYMTTGVWGYQRTGDASGSVGSGEVLRWSDSSSDPIKDISDAKLAIKKSTGMKANKLVLGAEVYEALKLHPDFIDRVNGAATSANPALVTRQVMAALFEVEELLVMEAVYNTAKRGQAHSGAFIGGKSALLVHTPKAPGLLTPAAGYTFAWTGYTGGTETMVSKFRMDNLKSDRVEIEAAFDQKLVSSALGAFFGSIIA